MAFTLIAMATKRIIFISVAIFIVICCSVIYRCDNAVKAEAAGKLFSNTAQVPYNKVGLLLGTSKTLGNGADNPFYVYRIQAATLLIKAGKIKYIIVSGDNSRVGYNEPLQMKEDLVQLGVDPSIIFLDYAGFRTFDSMVRLREVFGQDSVTVISQPFHNERAIYIASKRGIVAVGFNARNVRG